MVQFFMGVKPGVGPVLKILKYDNDDPLTLANDAYDRYYFNSENDKLSYAFSPLSLTIDEDSWPSGSDLLINFYGDSSTSKLSVVSRKEGNDFGFLSIGRFKNISNFEYIPMPEVRVSYPNSDIIIAGQRSINQSAMVIAHYQFPYNITKVNGKLNRYGYDEKPWSRSISDRFTNINIGDWIYSFSASISTWGGGGTWTTSSSRKVIISHWAIPADTNQMPTYSQQSGLETLRMDSDGIMLSRPGYSVNPTSGIERMILNSNNSPALCVMFGETNVIPANGNVVIPPPSGLILSETAVVDLLYREEGEELYIPGYVNHPFNDTTRFNFSYKVDSSGLTIFNDSDGGMIVRYAVFNTDESPISTGGNQIIYTGNNFIQVKAPGSTDPASRPNDVILDTRYPCLHIIKEGFIPLSQFSTSIAESQTTLGKVAYNVTFDGGGMDIYVKYTTVFDGYILPPMNIKRYSYIGPITSVGNSSNQSALARIRNNEVKFWLNPGNWSRLTRDGQVYTERFDGPDPLGIRYYIFGVANK